MGAPTEHSRVVSATHMVVNKLDSNAVMMVVPVLPKKEECVSDIMEHHEQKSIANTKDVPIRNRKEEFVRGTVQR